MATILITGGTGLIGTALSKSLRDRGDEVIVLSRNPEKQKSSVNISFASWNPDQGTVDEEAIQQSDFIIHLAGANVAEKRWTARRKKEIRDSRVQSGELLVKTLERIPNKVKAVLSASAIGYYGPDAELPHSNPFVESDPPSLDFLGQVSRKWEEAIGAVSSLNKRMVIFRTGIVLSKQGGAYREFKKPLRFGVSAILGKGKQMVSWIHIDDLVRLYIQALEEEWQGVFNAVSPHPVSNKELMRQIAKSSGKFFIPLHLPQLVLKAVLGEMSIEVLKSATVSAKKVQGQGFVFLFSGIQEAIKNLEKE